MAGDQLEEALRLVEVTSRKSELIEFEYCVSGRDAVNYVGSSLNPLCVTQVIPLKLIVSATQVRVPALLTTEAFAKKENISSKPEIEYLLYLAGSRQIKQTLEKIRRYGGEPYLVIRFCEKTAEEKLKRLPEEISCVTKDLESSLKPDIESIKEFYGLAKISRNELVKDILTLINNLRLQTKRE